MSAKEFVEKHPEVVGELNRFLASVGRDGKPAVIVAFTGMALSWIEAENGDEDARRNYDEARKVFGKFAAAEGEVRRMRFGGDDAKKEDREKDGPDRVRRVWR